jgi:hypothetical protein
MVWRFPLQNTQCTGAPVAGKYKKRRPDSQQKFTLTIFGQEELFLTGARPNPVQLIKALLRFEKVIKKT